MPCSAPDLDEGEKLGTERIGPERAQALSRLRRKRAASSRTARSIGSTGRTAEASAATRSECAASAVGQPRAPSTPDAAVAPDRGEGHPVFGQRAGLVDAQEGGRPERLDHGGAAHQHLVPGEAEGPERHEDRQHHRELFRQQRDGEGDPGQRAADPVAPQHAIGDARRRRAEREREDAELGDKRARRPLQQCRLVLDRGERGADAPEPGRGAGADDLNDALAAHVQGPGEEERRVISARLRIADVGDRIGCGRLETGTDSPVRADSSTVSASPAIKDAIGGQALALADQDEIAGHEFARRDAALAPPSGSRGRKARRVHAGPRAPARSGFLQDHEPDRHGGAGHHEQALADVAEHQVKPRRGQQEQEHRLAQDPADDVDQAAGALPVDCIGPILRESALRLGLVETGQAPQA